MRALAVLCALCVVLGCCGPQITHVYVPPEDSPSIQIHRTPNTAGVLSLCSEYALAGSRPVYASCAVIARRDGWWYVVTSKHCVVLSVYMPRGIPKRELPASRVTVAGNEAEVWYEDPKLDLAVVRFKSPSTFPVYPLARATIGQTVWAVGWPATLPDSGHPKTPLLHAQRGHISALDTWHIVHSAGTRPGFSGGGVLDNQSRLVGVTRSVIVGFGGFNYAIRADELEPVLAAIGP